jgi:hypothetical protein
MFTRHLLLLITLLALSSRARAQDTDVLLGHDLYHVIDRIDIQGLTGEAIPTLIKPYGRRDLTRWLQAADSSGLSRTEKGWYELMRLHADDEFAANRQAKTPVRWLYRNGRDLAHVQTGDLRLFVNPVIQWAGGADNLEAGQFAGLTPLTANHRGVVIRGDAWGKLGFHTEVSDQLGRFPVATYQHFDSTGLLFGETFIKQFGTQNGLNYFSSRGYLTVSPFRNLRIKFGKDRVLWGNGQQSLWLSDHAPDGLLLTLQARVWKFDYTSHFVQFIDRIPTKLDQQGTHPRKYGAFHQLSWMPKPQLALILFEGVIYSPNQPNGNRGFELVYLNPIIFYRSVEQMLGSPDNSVLGFSGKWNVLKRFQLYGQFLLDDYNFAQRVNGKNYWGNKLGWQTGLKYIDAFGISTLDLQAEYNRIRPYTYQHFATGANYSHYNQSLGHPGGGNLWEMRVSARYRPLPGVQILIQASRQRQGLDINGRNVGYDVNTPYINRLGGFDQVVGQGRSVVTDFAYTRVSWQPFGADLYLDAEAQLRRVNGASSVWGMAGVRTALVSRTFRN